MRMKTIGSGLVAFVFALTAAHTPLRAQANKADEVLAAMRTAIGNSKADAIKTFSLEAKIVRNAGNFQINTDAEIFLELPDKYVRSDTGSAPFNFQSTNGFNGDQSLSANGQGTATMGGATMIRMGPGGPTSSNEKLTPEQQAERNTSAVRSSRVELSRLMLGWFGMVHPSIKAEYSYAGDAQAPDGKADVIDIKDADGFAARLFIDQRTHLPLVLTYQGPQPRIVTSGGPAGAPGATTQTFTRQMPAQQGQQLSDEERKKLSEEANKRVKELQSQPPTMVEYKMYFSDWSAVDGIQFPHKIQRAMGDTPNEEWTITKVKVNPKIDSKKFQIKS